MKRFAVAFFVMALFLSNLAAEAASATFATRRGEVFQIILNGRLLPGPPADFIRLDRLPAGSHTIEFRVPARRGFLTFCTRIFLERGFETNYVLIPPGRYANFILKKVDMVPLRPPVVACSTCPPGRPHGGYTIQNPYDDYDYYQGQQGGNYNQQPGGYHNQQPGSGYHNGQQGPAPGYGGNPNGGNYGNGHGNGNSYNQPQNVMSTYDINLLIDSMSKRSFDSAKGEIARQALSNQYVMAEDAKRLVQQFGFESNRVDFAKFVYPRLYDQQNFYRVYEAFEFNSSITEMERWLKK